MPCGTKTFRSTLDGYTLMQNKHTGVPKKFIYFRTNLLLIRYTYLELIMRNNARAPSACRIELSSPRIHTHNLERLVVFPSFRAARGKGSDRCTDAFPGFDRQTRWRPWRWWRAAATAAPSWRRGGARAARRWARRRAPARRRRALTATRCCCACARTCPRHPRCTRYLNKPFNRTSPVFPWTHTCHDNCNRSLYIKK